MRRRGIATWLTVLTLIAGCSSVVVAPDGAGGSETSGTNGTDIRGTSATSPSDYAYCLDYADEGACSNAGCLWMEVSFHSNAWCAPVSRRSLCTFKDPSFGGGFDLTFGKRVVADGVLVTGLEWGPVVGFEYCSGSDVDYCPQCGLH